MLTKALSLELSPVRVNSVSPGFINNNFFNSSQITEKSFHKIKNHVKEKNPMKRLARIDEIVKTIIFLCSKKSRKITGQIIQVDGGLHCTSSAFVHWSNSWEMNSKIMPDGERTLNKFTSWVEKKIESTGIDYSKNPNWKQKLMDKSNWYTNLADAHVKVYNNYNEIDEDIDDIVIANGLQYDDDDDDDDDDEDHINNNRKSLEFPQILSRVSINASPDNVFLSTNFNS